MLNPSGGFYSTQDADSEGEEGKFFVWTPDEIQEVLGSDADAFIAAYSVTRHGNFEGKNILEFVGDMAQRPAVAEARRKLLEAREKRVHPGHNEVQLALQRQLPSNAAARVGSIAAIPALQHRALVDGQATAYVCQAFAWQAPVTEPANLQAQLAPRLA